jgi:hypothetical protein
VSLPAGTSVSLSAAAADDSLFTGWSLPACGTSNPCTFTLAANTTVTATFDQGPPPMTTLSVTKAGTGSGTVEGNGISCGVVCAVSLPVGTHVTLGATANEGSLFGSVFTQWSVPGCGASPTCSFTVTGFTSVTATFEKTSIVTVHNAATGAVQFLSGVKIVGPQSFGPLPGIAPGGSQSISTVTPGGYTAQQGSYPGGFNCPAFAFTLSAGATATLRYEVVGSALGSRRCEVRLE